MERMIKSSVRETQKFLQFRRSWIASGCPKNFKWDGRQRILDAAALREKLEDRLHPDRAETRKLRGQLDSRKQLLEYYHG